MAESMQDLKRTIECGYLDKSDIGETVVLMGWVNKRRDHGGLIFIDLRDKSGVVQTVFSREVNEEAFEKADTIRSEYVVAVVGKVYERPEGTINEELKTGHIEVYASELRILNRAVTPPFTSVDGSEVEESIRLKYRYLDLRRPDLHNVFKLRHAVIKDMRDFLDGEGFMEIETPVLTKSTPEGARDYLVPSRTHPGEFFALPQSPQIFKQLLMVSGFEKYFQIARCFRDEDLRADRQPEFTQLDMEMSFVNEDEIMEVVEDLVSYIFQRALDINVTPPFPRITYGEAIAKYGSDRPDLRFDMELADISDIAVQTEFKVFLNAVKNKGQVRGINARGCADYSRKEIDDLTEFAKKFGAKGLAWMLVTQEGIKSPISKFFTDAQINSISTRLSAEPGDLLLFVADSPEIVAEALGNLRLELAKRINLINSEEYKFAWITDFPLINYNEEDKRWEANHHPFTAPKDQDIDLLEKDPQNVKARAYDLVLNGTEIAGGSIRIHDREIQERIFRLFNLKDEEVKNKFGFLLEAFEYGAPPHGGIAFGLDRLIMIMSGINSIRDCIAFPKTQRATCLMTEAPSVVPHNQLNELGIKVLGKK